MFYDSVCLQDPRGWLIRFLVFECDDFKDCGITSMTS